MKNSPTKYCNQRRIAWWLNDALNEFPSTEARAAAACALDKAMRTDLLMDHTHGSVPQPVPSPILSPIPTSTHVTAPLTPLSQALFQNLQLHGSIQGHHDTAAPGDSTTVTAATPPGIAEATGVSEARILFDDVAAEDMEVRLTQHLLASNDPSGKVTANPSAQLPLPLPPLRPPHLIL